MMDLMCGPNAPLTRAFLFCGWRAGPVDLLLNPAQDLSREEFQVELRASLDQACLQFAALDCSTGPFPCLSPTGTELRPPFGATNTPWGCQG